LLLKLCSSRFSAIGVLSKFDAAEGAILGNVDKMLKCQVVVAHAIGKKGRSHISNSVMILLLGSPEGLFKWVLSDTDDFVRAEGLQVLANLAIRVSLACFSCTILRMQDAILFVHIYILFDFCFSLRFLFSFIPARSAVVLVKLSCTMHALQQSPTFMLRFS
jgi:hypothetical protein